MLTREQIDKALPGWSDQKQWDFFKSMLDRGVRRILMLGVYYGRDIAYIGAQAEPAMGVTVTGVDRFSTVPCADWPEGSQDCTWEQMTGRAAPDMEHTRGLLDQLWGDTPPLDLELVQGDDTAFLAAQPVCAPLYRAWDLIYVDTSHDYATVRNTLELAVPLLRGGGILAGDDYTNGNGWGVQRAVCELLPGHKVASGWVWWKEI